MLKLGSDLENIIFPNITTNGNPVKVGYKIDGKDVYVKRISKQLGDNTIVYAQTGLSNVKIINIDAVDTNGTEYHPLPMPDNVSNHIYEIVMYMPNVSQVAIISHSNRSSYTAYINIYFTYNS